MKIGKCDGRRSEIGVGQALSESRERYGVRGRVVAVEHAKAKRLFPRLGFRKSG